MGNYQTQLTQETDVMGFLRSKFKPVSAKAEGGVFEAKPIFLRRCSEKVGHDWDKLHYDGMEIAYKLHEPFSPAKGRNGRGFYGVTYKIIF